MQQEVSVVTKSCKAVSAAGPFPERTGAILQRKAALTLRKRGAEEKSLFPLVPVLFHS